MITKSNTGKTLLSLVTQEKKGIYVGKIDTQALCDMYQNDGNAIRYSWTVSDRLEKALEKTGSKTPAP